MKQHRNDPPKLAIWLLKHSSLGEGNESLTGDVVERFCEGRSSAWVWKQALIAFVIGVPTWIRRNWPLIGYALAGSAMTFVIPGIVIPDNLFGGLAFQTWMWNLPFPLSMLVYIVGSPALLAAEALPILVVGLMSNGALRRFGLFRTVLFSLRTWLYSLVLITIGPFLVFLPDPNLRNVLLLPVGPVKVFYILLISAWLGCHSSRRVSAPAKSA